MGRQPRVDTPCPVHAGVHTHPLPSASWDTHTLTQCMLGYIPPPYSSHWNAFLFRNAFTLFEIDRMGIYYCLLLFVSYPVRFHVCGPKMELEVTDDDQTVVNIPVKESLNYRNYKRIYKALCHFLLPLMSSHCDTKTFFCISFFPCNWSLLLDTNVIGQVKILTFFNICRTSMINKSLEELV